MKLKEIREMYPEGTQIVLTEMAGESQMPYGLKGTVKFVDDAGQIHMSWENGSSLALNINEDTFEKVEAPEKISVILVEPGRYPKLIEIEDTLEAMQSLVEGDIEEYMPFEDEVAIICNDEGKMNGLPLNRAVYSEPENVEMSYPQLKAHFRQAEKERNHTTGYIVFTDDSFDKPYTEEQRTYVVSSNNKAFIEGMGGYSIYASSLDGSDKCVRLEAYMADEHGGKDGWKIEKCYVKDTATVKCSTLLPASSSLHTHRLSRKSSSVCRKNWLVSTRKSSNTRRDFISPWTVLKQSRISLSQRIWRDKSQSMGQP